MNFISEPRFSSMRLVSPVGEIDRTPVPLAPRLATLEGKSIGFIDNFKPGAAPFLRHVEAMLIEKYPGIRTQTVHKNFTSNVLIADELEGRVDAVVNAWGD
ncbi:MAG: hypothetical protein FJY55_03880 [Betaproteobacteria bacterium]|nr:hypothetical protein [Betaproteobacteria bacterium]